MTFLATGFTAGAATSADPLKVGASLYRPCFYCHSLRPDVHLTGPSLANLWNHKAGHVRGFDLYSTALRTSSVIWTEETLKTWLANPQKLIPGTTMTYPGLGDQKSRDDLVAFLKIALGAKGFEKTQEMKLIAPDVADGQLPKDLSRADEKDRIVKILHCGKTYTVTAANGVTTEYWEMNLDLKTNSGPQGPQPGRPVRLETGSMGDRFAIVFHDPAELISTLKTCATKPGSPSGPAAP